MRKRHISAGHNCSADMALHTFHLSSKQVLATGQISESDSWEPFNKMFMPGVTTPQAMRTLRGQGSLLKTGILLMYRERGLGLRLWNVRSGSPRKPAWVKSSAGSA